jgi:probable DNA repair protein
MRRMSATLEFLQLSKTEVFARLAAGTAADVTLVTPNRRLALALKHDFDGAQARAGRTMWNTADILPFAAFVERAYHEALYSAAAPGLPLLLTSAQEHQLWEDAITASEWGDVLLTISQTAAQCRDAWQLAHAWRIAGALGAWDGDEDAQAFAAWAHVYADHGARDRTTDTARLPDLVASLLQKNAWRKPGLLVAYAFDMPTAQQRDFFAACSQAGIEVRVSGPAARATKNLRLACAATNEELERAAYWARARLERHADAMPRIGIVVPDLEQCREKVMHVFSRVLEPGGNLPGAVSRPPSFNISLGLPLADYPLIAAALAVFETASGPMDFAVLSRLIRAPFVGGAETEMMCRAQLDAALRERAPPQLTLPKLLGMLGTNCPLLAQQLSALSAYVRQHLGGSSSPQQWARHFSALLDAVGFPGARTLDSGEFQARAKFYEVLGEFAQLERVVPKLVYAQARARLRRLCAETLFQPESGTAPIQVLGIFEAAGLEFDHLWISGLTDEAWPLAARPNPFIPPALQKKAGIPQAAAETSLALDRRLTAGWLGAAAEVIVSHPLREQDRELVPSPLLADVAAGSWAALDVPDYPRYRDVIYQARASEYIADGAAPALAAKSVRGGTRVLVDQAACPFRAFARHRLGAWALSAPEPGLDAKSRGILLHALLGSLWEQLKTRAALEAASPERLNTIIERAAAAAVAEVRARRPDVLEGQFGALERERLAGLAREWLAVERQRSDFEVVALEHARELHAAKLSLRGRIDRMDRLADGSYALIDYKTGHHVTPDDWQGARPDDPQLPLYAINALENIAAIAFAKVRTGEMRFTGFSRVPDALPKVKAAESWNGLLDGWRREIEALGQAFADGDARVAPKRLFDTCKYCDLQALCRVHERFSALAEEEEDGAE